MTFFNKVLKIKPGEEKRVFLFTLYYFFLISALIVGKTARDTFFLSRFNPDFLPYMFMIVAVVVSVTVVLYVKIASRFSQLPLIKVTALIFIASLILIQIFLSTWIYPLLYVWIEVIGTIMIPQFWLLANSSFTTREAKRLFSILGAGGAIANTLVGFSIRPFVKLFGTEFLLVIAAIFLVACFFIVWTFHHLIPQISVQKRSKRFPSTTQNKKPIRIFQSSYLKTITLVVTIATIVGALIDYQLKIIASQSLSESEIATVFGTMYGVVGIASIIMQFFITGRILAHFGILIGLFLLPMTLIAGSALILVSPVILSALITRTGDYIFRYTINDTSSQLLWLPVSHREKSQAKPFIDGTIKNGAQGISGILILIIIGVFDIRILSVLAVALTLVWISALFKVKKGYMEELKKAISKRSIDFSSLEIDFTDPVIVDILRKTLTEGDDHQKLFVLDSLKEMSLTPWKKDIRKLFKEGTEIIREKILDLVGNDPKFISNDEIISLLKSEEKRVIPKVILIAGQRKILEVEPLLAASMSSDNPENRAAAAAALLLWNNSHKNEAKNILDSMIYDSDEMSQLSVLNTVGHLQQAITTKGLVKLLSASSTEVQKLASEIAGERSDPHLIPVLVENLKNPATTLTSRHALQNFDPAMVLNALLDELKTKSLHEDSVKYILYSLRDYADHDTISALIDFWNQASEKNQYTMIETLVHIARHTPFSDQELIRSDKLLKDSLKRYYYYLNALYLFSEESHSFLIKKYLENRLQQVKLNILKLCLLPHPDCPIEQFTHAIKTSNSAALSNVLEFLDNILPKENCNMVLSVLDETPEKEKLDMCRKCLGAVTWTMDDLLRAWTGSSENWISAVAIDHIFRQFLLGNYEENKVRSLIDWQNLPDSDLMKEIIGRVWESPVKNLLKENIHYDTNRIGEDLSMFSTLEKTIFLTGVNLFHDISGEEVSHVAQIAQEYTMGADESIFLEGDAGDSMFIIVDGRVRIHKNNSEIAVLSKGEFIGEMALLDQEPRSASATTVDDTILLKIDREDFYDLMASRMDIMQGIVKVLTGRLREAIG